MLAAHITLSLSPTTWPLHGLRRNRFRDNHEVFFIGATIEASVKAAPPEAEPSSSSGVFTEDMTCDSQHAKGKIHVLEVVAGSAGLNQCCALTGLKVGTPIDIRTGFDVMT